MLPKGFAIAGLTLMVPTAVVAVACGEESDEAADYGKACLEDDCLDPAPDDFACPDVVDGRDPSFPNAGQEDVLAARRDPLAVLVLKQPGECPVTYGELLDKLRLEERTGCDEGGRAGLLSFVVSERGRILGTPEPSRAVVFRECGGRPSASLAFHVQELDAAQPMPPGDDVEVMGLDGNTGAFNFYSLRAGQWTYHGSSFDYAGSSAAAETECGGCHTAGGLLMRELHAPWGPWHGALDLPGAAGLVDRYEDLGQLSRAAALEDLVRRGNRRWNIARAASSLNPDRVEAHGGSLAFLLEPLFCPTGYDLASVGEESLAGRPPVVMALATDFFVDPLWDLQDAIPISAEAYHQVTLEVGTRVDGVSPATDTRFPWTYVRRSEQDVEYIRTLLEANIVDLELVHDVLSVDPTRPVFSDARCGLLEYVPRFEALSGPVSPVTLAQGLIDRLQADPVAPGTPAARLLARLTEPGQAVALREGVRSFLAACAARASADGGAALIRDAFEVQALRRSAARAFSSALDTVGVIADDDLDPSQGLRFDPQTCELR